MAVFDCFEFDGDVAALVQRLEALSESVDHFVVVEVIDRSTAEKAESTLRQQWAELKPWARQLRHVIVSEPKPASLTWRQKGKAPLRSPDPHAGLAHIGRGLADLTAGDVVILAQMRDIPARAWIEEFMRDPMKPTELFTVSDTAVWQPGASVGGVALRVGEAALPSPSQTLKAGLKSAPPARPAQLIGARIAAHGNSQATVITSKDRRPMIICAYLHDRDEVTVRQAFGLDDERGSRLPFFLWQDTERIGPERAFQHCWNQFPDRDVIIIHPDMAPMPDDPNNTWYEKLCAYRNQLPDAGIIGCDLIFPEPTQEGDVAAQCVGGRIRAGKIKHVGGRNHPYNERYTGVRQMDWATFGGVLIRREAIDMVGPFDETYKWAYVMDVDYCMAVQLRGMRIYQVPVNIIHAENGTTKDFLKNPEYKATMFANFTIFEEKWASLFRGKSSSGDESPSFGLLPKFPGG